MAKREARLSWRQWNSEASECYFCAGITPPSGMLFPVGAVWHPATAKAPAPSMTKPALRALAANWRRVG